MSNIHLSICPESKQEGLWENDVKLLLIDACLQCECNKITIVFACEDVDQCISRMSRGDVALWVLTDDYTHIYFGRVLDDEDANDIKSINKHHGIKKMYRIERMTVDFDVVELKIND